MKDHMVQDVDADLDSYGEINEHPELLNVNVTVSGGGGPGGGGGAASDWFHVNGVDYNPTLDQIVFSSRFLSELFIIDHSTTTEEAASHAGGNSGMGGDFLYRWGHPSNYGAEGAQIITSACHDARWIIDDGRPNGGFLQVFNNLGNNGNSAVDAIDAPVDGYNYAHEAGQAFEPASYSWRHNCIANAPGQSASDRMADGNIFVNLSGGQGGAGYMYEVDTDGNVLFQYNAQSAKAFRYPCSHLGIQALLENPCPPGVGISEVLTLNWSVFPNPSEDGIFTLAGEFGLEGVDLLHVSDALGREICSMKHARGLDLSGQPSGIYWVTATFDGLSKTRKVLIQ